MTKTLTEQWREGTLPDDTYYWKVFKENWIADKHEMYDYTKVYDVNKIECLAPVPSYDKLQTKDMLLDSYKKENKRLKAVAEHCENVAGKWADKLFDTEKKVECIEKQLKIATKALKDIQVRSQRNWDEYDCMSCATRALVDIVKLKDVK